MMVSIQARSSQAEPLRRTHLTGTTLTLSGRSRTRVFLPGAAVVNFETTEIPPLAAAAAYILPSERQQVHRAKFSD